MDRIEKIIRQHLYWTGIKNAVHNELTNCDTCQCTKISIIKYGKLSAKEADEIAWNKLFVYIIGP